MLKKNYKIIIFVSLFFVLIFIAQDVFAQTVNYAPTGIPSYANRQAGNNNYLIWTFNNSRLNDGSISDTAHGVVISDGARYSTWASFYSIITFPTPIAQLDRIEAVLGQYGGNQASRLIAYVDTGLGWQQVGDTGYYQPPTRPYTQIFNSGAPWYNVNRIMVYSYSLTSGWAWVDYRLFELRAFGPSAISYQDIGLRMKTPAEIVSIAAEIGPATSPLRISRGGVVYGVALVDPGDANDSGVRIRLASGEIKALRKL